MTLSHSPAGHPVYGVIYGNAEPDLKGTANFNSALGARDKDAYVRRAERQHPVLCIIAGIHGQEVEGMVAALSLIEILERGYDLRGNLQSELVQVLKNWRVIIIPLANPDGRLRCPYNGWVGLPQEEMTKWGQGTRQNGELYRWAPSKAIHPMRGDVGILGAYFDDKGVNMMHDNWAAPMSDTTTALLKLVANEGPDFLLNLHSYSFPPGILPVHYTPLSHQEKVHVIAKRYIERIHQLGYRAAKPPAINNLENADTTPAFNLQSMFFHVGSDVNILFESPHGNNPNSPDFSYEDILEIHHELLRVIVV